jgi:hypothetical protein
LKLSVAARRALTRHISRVVARLDPARYHQEPAYVAALFARLDSVVYRGPNLTIEIKSTVIDDRGRNSAESVWGADFGIVASIVADGETTEKAVLGQAKRASLVTLPPAEAELFQKQVVKMSSATPAILGLEVPTEAGIAPIVRVLEVSEVFGQTWAAQSAFSPRKYEAKIFSKNASWPPVLLGPALSLDQYLYAELLKCQHGDQEGRLLRGLESSSLTALRIEARSVF